VGAGLALSDEAGWNQTIEDWGYFLQRGSVFGIRDAERRLIASAALLPFPPVTWISMVLVTQNWRRRGLANRVVSHCIETARARQLEPWLDATPAGATVYRPMGFAATEIGLKRLRRMNQGSNTGRSEIAQDDLEQLVHSDRGAMGFERGDLIRHFAGREGSAIYRSGDAVGLVRAGRNARQIGPVYAKGEKDALALLDRILAEESASLVIDLSAAQTKAEGFLVSRGFAFERPYSRMRFGTSAPAVRASSSEMIAVAGPEFG
jgi:N-acetylglutamate synthase-like GNAT family acetyltransferase